MVGFLVIDNNPYLDPSWPGIPDKYIHMQVCLLVLLCPAI